MTEVEKLMIKYGEETIKLMKNELVKGKKADSRFIKMMKSYVDKKEYNLILTLEMPEYGVWIDSGRKAGSKLPPKGSLLNWMGRKGIPKKNEYVIRKHISVFGVKKVPFLYIWEKRYGKMKREIAEKYKIDIERNIRITAEKISDK